MMRDEVRGDMDNSLWFEVYSCALQRVGEAMSGWQWRWPKGKAQEIVVSPLVRAFWEEMGVEPAASCTRLCWELQPRVVFRRRKRGNVSHVITFLDDMAVHTPTLDAWDKFVWPPIAAIPHSTTQAKQYGYRHGNAIDLGTVMPAEEFRVTNVEGAYLCAVRGLIFKGSILVYDPTRDEVEWVPTCGVANNLSWAEERMAVVLANFVPRAGQEADRITELGAHRLAWTDDSSSEEEGEEMQEEDDTCKETQEEDDMHEEMQEADECIAPPHLEDNEYGEVEGQGDPDPGNEMQSWGEAKLEREWRRWSREWASIMDDEQPLTFDDLQSNSDHSTLCSTVVEDVVEVHAPDLELQTL